MNIKTLKENMRRFKTKNLSEQVVNEDNGNPEEPWESGDHDYDVAVKFAKNVEDWWGGSADLTNKRKKEFKGYHDFFKKFQGGFWGYDEDAAASTAYNNYAQHELIKQVGKDNKYYNELVQWIEDISTEIKKGNQEIVWLHLKSADNQSSSFKVDPEIDVAG